MLYKQVNQEGVDGGGEEYTDYDGAEVIVAAEAVEPVEEVDRTHECAVAPRAERVARGDEYACPDAYEQGCGDGQAQPAVEHHRPRERYEEVIDQDIYLVVGEPGFLPDPNQRIGHEIENSIYHCLVYVFDAVKQHNFFYYSTRQSCFVAYIVNYITAVISRQVCENHFILRVFF